MIEELYTVNKHFTDLSPRIDSGKYHKEIATLWEDCASKNDVIKILVEDLSKYKNSFIKLTKKTTIQATLPSRFSDLNCDEVNTNVLDDEINISNVLKTRHNNTTRPRQNAVQNPHQSPVVVHNSPENHHDFRRSKTAPGENSYSEVVKDHKGNENNIVIFSDSIANFHRCTKAKINNSIRKGRVSFRSFPGKAFV